MKKILFGLFLCFSVSLSSQTWQEVGGGLSGNLRSIVELDGKIYVGGNVSGDFGFITQYDPATDQWTDIDNGLFTCAPDDLYGHNGYLYAGALISMFDNNYVARFNPATGEWEGLGDSNYCAITEICILNDTIYTGGFAFCNKSLIGSGVWEEMASNNANEIHGFTIINADIYAYRKQTTADTWEDYSMLKYDNATGQFTGLAQGNCADGNYDEIQAVGTDIYCAGTLTSGSDIEGVRVFHTETNTYSIIPANTFSATTSVVHHNGYVYVSGAFQLGLQNVLAYDIATDTWLETGSILGPTPKGLAVANNVLYAVGSFSSFDSNVIKLDLSLLSVEDDEGVLEGFRVYPNPCNEYLIIKNADINEVVSIYDITGQLFLSQQVLHNRIDVSSLPAGYYSVHSTKSPLSASLLKL